MSEVPALAITIGDPAGIGPEVVVRALAAESLLARVLLVGDTRVVADAVRLVGAKFAVSRVGCFEDARFATGTLDVLDPGTLSYGEIPVGRLSALCGRAVTEWSDIALQLARDAKVGAVIKAPVNFEAIRLSGALPAIPPPAGETHILLIAGPLRVVHLTDHIPLRGVFARISRDAILRLIRLTHVSLTTWGIAAPKIGVAGLNPHAIGDEEQWHIQPAIEAARGEGIDAHGPVSPDSVFRQGVHGAYDCVIAHYHDQGHIAVKTFKFDGNCALVLSDEPFLRVSVAHGTAFDIAGKGIADFTGMAAAIKTAAFLAGGKGFPPA